jgi:hypothetical protein
MFEIQWFAGLVVEKTAFSIQPIAENSKIRGL